MPGLKTQLKGQKAYSLGTFYMSETFKDLM